MRNETAEEFQAKCQKDAKNNKAFIEGNMYRKNQTGKNSNMGRAKSAKRK